MALSTIKENPKGLHSRYYIQKVVGEWALEWQESAITTNGLDI